jgi:transposase
MRYELTDFEWSAIRPFLPNKPRGVPRVNDRRVLNGIFWILRSGAPWCDLPESFGPYTTCYNRFVRWRMAGIWDLIMKSLAESHDGSVQMIDTSIVRVHQHGGCAGGGETRLMGRSRGGLGQTRLSGSQTNRVKTSRLPQESRCQKGEPSVFNEQAYASDIRSAEEPFEKELEEPKIAAPKHAKNIGSDTFALIQVIVRSLSRTLTLRRERESAGSRWG